MQSPRRAVRALVILATVSSGLAVVPFGSAALASSGFCSQKSSYAGTTIMWTGKGNGHSWGQAANWSPHQVPDVHQKPATYQKQFVCIGDGVGGKPAAVTVSGTSAFHIGGLDVGQAATLTVQPGGGLFLGAVKGATPVASSVDRHSKLLVEAATLGGNSPLTVSGTLRWTGLRVEGHKRVATQASSECGADPTIPACPGDTSPTGGRTTIAHGGKLVIDGAQFGGSELVDHRVIDNFGTIRMANFGYLAMNTGTSLIDEPHSAIDFDGIGGIYRGSSQGGGAAPTVQQHGAIVRDGGTVNVAIVGVPVIFGATAPAVTIRGGSLSLDTTRVPKAPVERAGGYGVGSCVYVPLVACKQPVATGARPQVALVGTSSESASPKVSRISVSLAKGPAKVHGHAVLGQATVVTAPTKKTTHSMHLTLKYDVSTPGLKPSIHPKVYRDGHAITLCRVHGLTAKNTSCVFTAGITHSGSGAKGDLSIVLITIQPNAHWLVAR